MLRSIRGKLPQSTPLPDLEQPWTTYEDRREQFVKAVELVGGQCIFCHRLEDVPAALQQLSTWNEAATRCVLVPGLNAATLDLNAVDDPHDLADVDVAVAPGEFGVAENGAIWVNDRGVRHRAIYFITQHLAMVLPAHQIVDNMHQAYERLQFGRPEFGVFISGPSKTADIEQSLVVGAHGARSLTVFLLDEQSVGNTSGI
jgi:L-lactate dehydrogenase complex protein LldG